MPSQSTIPLCPCGCGNFTSTYPNGRIKRLHGHWRRNRAHLPLADRFWEKVDKDGCVPSHCPEIGECWLWIGAKDHGRYGRLPTIVPSRKAHESKAYHDTRATHISWELHFGPIPDGLKVCHRCDNPPCVRPDHLFLGTQTENIRDMEAKGRRRSGPNAPSSQKPHR